MVPPPVSAFGMPAVIMFCFELARICFRRFGGKVKICTIKGYRFCMYKAPKGVRGLHAAYEHRSDLIRCRLVLLWMYRSFLYRTFFNFSTISSCCRCKILRWEMCRRFFIHIQLVFMHCIVMTPLRVKLGGAFRTRTIEGTARLSGRLPPRRFVAKCSRGCDNMLDALSHSRGSGYGRIRLASRTHIFGGPCRDVGGAGRVRHFWRRECGAFRFVLVRHVC